MPRRRPIIISEAFVAAITKKPPRQRLPQSEWNFQSCPASHLPYCKVYEFARSSESQQAEIGSWKRCEFLGFDQPLDPSMDFERHWRLNFFRLFPEFPEKPWLDIDKLKIEERILSLKQIEPIVIRTVSPKKLIHEGTLHDAVEVFGFQHHGTIQAIEINWLYNAKSLLVAFRKWLRENAPIRPNEQRGGRNRDLNLLNALAAKRLLEGRLISDVATEMGQVLAPHGIYNQAEQPVVHCTKTNTIDPIKPAKFRTWIEQFVVTVDPKKDEIKTMGSSEAGSILISKQFIDQLREVERVNHVRLPVMREDGKIELLPEGYDRATKILTGRDSVRYATDMEMEAAKGFLDELLKEFPFADDGRSRAVSIAAMLTMFGLDLMPTRTVLPVFLYKGNHPGLGKGLLAQAAILPILGYAPTGVNPKDDTEMRKLLFAIAKQGNPVVFLDNVTGKLASPSLESFITTSTVTGRVLGSSTSLNCKKNSVVFVTGNNCTLNGDMARRTLIAELFLAGDPADRKIEKHLDENRLLELRADILAALYALVRHWAEAGKPAPSQVNASFAVWAKTIGAIIEHAGFGSIAPTAVTTAAVDPKEVDMFALTNVLVEARRTEAVKFIELIALMHQHELFKDILKPGEPLGKHENTTLGRFLSAQQGRMFNNGLRFVILGKGHARRYAVQRVAAMDAEVAAA